LVHTLDPALAVAAAFVLLLLPGLAFLSLLREDDRARLALDERLFLTGAVSVACSAWTALLLAELGVFSTARAAAVEVVAVILALVAGRLLGRSAAWPLRFLDGRIKDALPAVIVAITAFALHAKPSEYIVGGRDPGAYVSAMGVIARTGAITHQDPVVTSIPKDDLSLFYANLDEPPFRFTLDVFEDKPQVSWPRFMGFELDHPASGRITPQFFHLFPAFGAYLFETMGVRGALATPPIFGILGTLAAFFVGRRFFDSAPAGMLGAFGLATSVLQVWFARYPVSEGSSQFLILCGILAFLIDRKAESRTFAVTAGVFFGLSLLVRIDSVLLIAPLGLWAGTEATLRRDPRWKARVVAVVGPFALLLVHSMLHAVLFSKRYAHQILTRRYWNHSPAVWLAALVLIAIVVIVAWRLGPRIASWLAAHDRSIRSVAIAALFLCAAYAVALRPSLSAWAGGDGNPREEKLADPGPLKALGFDRLAAHDAQALRRYAWFVGAPALTLAFIGLAVFLRRKAATDDLLPFAIVVVFASFYFYKIRVFNDYFFAMRRYMPVTLPFTFLFAAYALVVLAKKQRAIATLLGFAAAGGSILNTVPVLGQVDWRGSVRFVADVARRFGPGDVVLFEQPKNIHLLSLPLWGLYGVNALEFRRFNPDPGQLRHLVSSWRPVYRNIYLVTSFRTDVCGLFLERTQTFRFTSEEFEWTYDRVPRKAEGRAVEFVLSRVVEPEALRIPVAPEIDIGGSGDSQISGFFDAEATGNTTYRWTGGCLDGKGNATGMIYAPAAAPGAVLRIRATSHLRPSTAKPADVAVYLGDVPVGRFTATNEWKEFDLTLPDVLPPGPPTLRLEVPAWRPSNTDPRSTDTRDLGVMIDWVRLTPRISTR
jgi:hypothetical protein